jgi:hypothetical protein
MSSFAEPTSASRNKSRALRVWAGSFAWLRDRGSLDAQRLEHATLQVLYDTREDLRFQLDMLEQLHDDDTPVGMGAWSRAISPLWHQFLRSHEMGHWLQHQNVGSSEKLYIDTTFSPDQVWDASGLSLESKWSLDASFIGAQAFGLGERLRLEWLERATVLASDLRHRIKRVSQAIHLILRCRCALDRIRHIVVLEIPWYLVHGCHPPATSVSFVNNTDYPLRDCTA